MNTLQLSLHYNQAIIASHFRAVEPAPLRSDLTVALVNEMQNLGFIPSEDFLKVLKTGFIDIESLYDALILELLVMVGDHVDHTPMYPNFPKQVAEMSNFDLYFNAFIHYFSFGTWLPEYEKEVREKGLELNVKYKIIDVVTEEQVWEKINKIAQSPDSITEFDKQAIQWAIDNNKFNLDEASLSKIVFAETRCIVLAGFVKNDDLESFNRTINNMTDILRVATYMSDGDISLAKNTKFRNFKRSERRLMTLSLETFWDNETAVRHRNKWVKLLHSLHVGDYSQKVWEKAQALRAGDHIETFNGEVEARIKALDIKGAIECLKRRPSEFARRLDHLLRLSNSQTYVLNQFGTVIDNVPTKILVQLIGHFENRVTDRKTVVLPKGAEAKAVLIDQKGELSNTVKKLALNSIRNTLMVRFSDGESLGKVYIDKGLKNCPVPSGMRSVPNGLVTVPRGTQFDFGDDPVLRFFVHWKGQDIDLSATFHDENFKYMTHVSYTNLKEGKCLHSGDVVCAPDGANEYIDIDVEWALTKARYVALNLYVFNGPNFSDHEECFVGWMTRSNAEKGPIFDAKTVKQKIDMTAASRIACPVIFDMKERKAIFVNMSKVALYNYWGNNVESNKAGFEDILYAVVNPKKMSLYDLFNIHALTRADEVVENREDADFVFGVEEGNVTAYDWAAIQTDWIGVS